MIGPEVSGFISLSRAVCIACATVSYAGAVSRVTADRAAFGFNASYESGEKGVWDTWRSAVEGGRGLTDLRRGTMRDSELTDFLRTKELR
jgi:hypothetical protein